MLLNSFLIFILLCFLISFHFFTFSVHWLLFIYCLLQFKFCEKWLIHYFLRVVQCKIFIKHFISLFNFLISWRRERRKLFLLSYGFFSITSHLFIAGTSIFEILFNPPIFLCSWHGMINNFCVFIFRWMYSNLSWCMSDNLGSGPIANWQRKTYFCLLLWLWTYIYTFSSWWNLV